MICTLLSSCTPQGKDLAGERIEVRFAGTVQNLTLLSPPAELVARRPVALVWACEPCEALPAELELVADMPQMSHGPTRVPLQREGALYRGSLLFVMGGRWELKLMAGEEELLRGWIEVRERP